MGILHQVGAVHAPHLGVQVATAHVLVLFSAVDDGLHPYHAFPLYFPVFAIAVEDVPVAAVQLYRKGIVVFYGDAVRKHILGLNRIGVILLVKSLNTHLNAFRNFTVHTTILVNLIKVHTIVKKNILAQKFPQTLNLPSIKIH